MNRVVMCGLVGVTSRLLGGDHTVPGMGVQHGGMGVRQGTDVRENCEGRDSEHQEPEPARSHILDEATVPRLSCQSRDRVERCRLRLSADAYDSSQRLLQPASPAHTPQTGLVGLVG